MSEDQKAMLEALKANSKRQGGRRFKKRKYIVKEDGDVNVKLSPQAIRCLEILFEGGKLEYTEEEAHGLFDGADMGKSKQEPWKVFQYYRKSLVDAGWIVLEKIEDKS